MAFHQRSTRPSLQRVVPLERRDSSTLPNRPPSRHIQGGTPTTATATGASAAVALTPASDDPQTWVLFSPASDSHTTSYLSDASLLTPGRSRVSEFGSLRPPIPRARGVFGDDNDDAIDDQDDEDESFAEDDGELDSLDSHLPEFRNHPYHYHDPPSYSAPVARTTASGSHYRYQHQHQHQQQMPAHDGLGSFRIHQPATDADVQEQIYAHERFNRRLRRRRESLDKAERALRNEENEALTREAEKMQRIEAWRLEQSRILLDEIQKLTRQRRQSQASMGQYQQSSRGAPVAREGASSRTSRRAPDEGNLYWHDEDAMVMQAQASAEPQGEGFWTRMTKKVIRDLMGIDDRLLSILFGETLPEDEDLLTSTARASPALYAARTREVQSSWHLHVLERVARELGMLVNNLSHHPGAFSTYTRVQQAPLPYAGLPVIPERSIPSQAPHSPVLDSSSPYLPDFQPSRPQAPPPRHVDLRDSTPRSVAGSATTDSFTQEEWEQDLDIKLVFRYLRSRFSSQNLYAQASNTPLASTSHLATASMQDMAAKSARVRQHHPLISRPSRVFKPVPVSGPVVATPGPGTAAMASAGEGSMTPGRPAATTTTGTNTASDAVMAAAAATALRARRTSSCASLSTRRSAVKTRRNSGSSRHYWDLGGSARGTGSVIASAGPMGSWGEV